MDALHVVENVGPESVLLATHCALALVAVLGLLDVLQQHLPGPWRHTGGVGQDLPAQSVVGCQASPLQI